MICLSPIFGKFRLKASMSSLRRLRFRQPWCQVHLAHLPSTWARSKPPSGSVDPSIPITFEDLDTHSTTVPYISWHPWIESTQHTVILILYIYIIYMVKSCKIIQVIQDAQGGFLLPSVSLWELRVQCLRSSFGSCRRGASPGWVI